MLLSEISPEIDVSLSALMGPCPAVNKFFDQIGRHFLLFRCLFGIEFFDPVGKSPWLFSGVAHYILFFRPGRFTFRSAGFGQGLKLAV